MTSVEQKRPLPPTPATNNISNSMDSTENEKKLLKLLEKKDSTISNLKTIIIEWKKKAIDAEEAYKLLQQQSREREQFLIKQHEAEIEALTKIHATETNENLDLLVRLENENKALQSKYQNETSSPIVNHYVSNTGQLCDTAEVANQMAMNTIESSKQDSDELIQRINEMVIAMEGTLHDFQHIQDELTVDKPHDSTPLLVSDSSSSSDESFDEDIVLATPKKKKTPRTNSISSFLFNKNKRTTEDHHEASSFKRITRTLSLSSQTS